MSKKGLVQCSFAKASPKYHPWMLMSCAIIHLCTKCLYPVAFGYDINVPRGDVTCMQGDKKMRDFDCEDGDIHEVLVKKSLVYCTTV